MVEDPEKISTSVPKILEKLGVFVFLRPTWIGVVKPTVDGISFWEPLLVILIEDFFFSLILIHLKLKVISPSLFSFF